jgi:hypothetical protein
MAIIVFTGTKLLVPIVLFRKQKFNQDHLLVMIAPQLSKEHMSTKQRVGKNKLVVHMDNSMCHNWCKIREYFARKTIAKVPHPVCSPNLSPYGFCFFGYANEWLKNQIITSEDDMENKLTNVCETVRGGSSNQCSTSGCQDWNG